MSRIAANGIEIEYESFGTPGNPPLLLIMGLGGQMILWPDDFCMALANRGFYVTRFDNRDIGRSTWMTEAGMPDVGALMAAMMMGSPVEASYTLSDMAADAAGLLEALGIPSAHVVGASMGGMIAQTLAIEHPSKVRTLTSIMSTTGDRSLPPPTPAAMSALMAPPADGLEANLDRAVSIFRTIGSPGFPFDEEFVRDVAKRSYERGFQPEGIARQMTAIVASGSRKEKLGEIRVPTLVLHGKNDPLIPYAAAVATAEAIPGAKLVGIEGMGHDLPREVWPTIIDEVCALAARA